MSRTTLSIGDPDGSQGPATSPRFGWRKLDPYTGHAEAEERVGESLIGLFGVFVTHAGDRTQSHDLEVSGVSCRQSRYDRGGLAAGLYEVKSLWRKNERSSFDRRFKVGTRGERIYGRRDSQIKAFAVALEDELEHVLESNVRESKTTFGRNTDFVESAHAFIDQAMGRRHSKAFEERLMRLARASLNVPRLTVRAQALLDGAITNADVLRGFSDIQGIFVVAGDLFTLVTKGEFGSFIGFDSASSEGPKLRLIGEIPSEAVRLRMREASERKMGQRSPSNKDRRSNKKL
jgi:hypothetical protein